MSENKTKPTRASVKKFLAGIENETRRNEALAVAEVMQTITKLEPKMWGPNIVGFGKYRYRYESGREGEWFLTGFSPRKDALTLYIMSGFEREAADLMAKLGKYKNGKSCLHIKKLEDVDTKVLRQLIRKSVQYVKKTSV